MNLQMDRALQIGIVFETFDAYGFDPQGPTDAHVEYEPLSTVEVLEQAIRSLGHCPVRIGSPFDLLNSMSGGADLGVDAALNLAEGRGSRNREAWAPVLLEMVGIPCLGSDALTLSMTLDKAWANRQAAAAGIRVAPQCVLAGREAALTAPLPSEFPLFVKPRWEGTAKGIRSTSRVETRAALATEVERIVADYQQPALVEGFISGPEYTVTLVGHHPPRSLPVVQRALDPVTRIGWHAIDTGVGAGGEERPAPCAPGSLTSELEATLASLGLAVFELFECLDFARADFRLGEQGEPIFLEINPLPTFGVESTFAVIAELAGRPLYDLLAEILDAGLRRLASAPEGLRGELRRPRL